MQNGARYIVTTHWGTFSLDEASYQDYLAGKLWISWTPGTPQQQKQNYGGHVPPDVTERAISLRDDADKVGVMATLQQIGGRFTQMPYTQRLADFSIDEMNLTVRSSNGLKRAGIHTFGALKDILDIENGLQNVRNIGQKSIAEIRQLFLEECYTRLLPYEKAQYWQEILDA